MMKDKLAAVFSKFTNLPSDNWRTAWLWAITLTISLRLGLGVLMGFTWLMVERYLPPNHLQNDLVYGRLDMPSSLLGRFWLSVWPRWDATHHLNLAMRGYFDVSVGDTVFYPLYAGLTRLTAELLGHQIGRASCRERV